MSDAQERALERAALEGSLKAWADVQRAQCRKNEHCWSNWVSNHSVGSGMWIHWRDKGFESNKSYSVHTRECLACPARERMLRKLGGSQPYKNTPGMSYRPATDEVIFDV
jgi:hypothetical protein